MCMRTTLSIDDDVLIAVRERAARERRTAGEVLSELARAALTGGIPGPRGEESSRHGFRPLPRRGPAVSNTLIDELRDEDGTSSDRATSARSTRQSSRSTASTDLAG